MIELWNMDLSHLKALTEKRMYQTYENRLTFGNFSVPGITK